jgi:hypothetical protein
MLENGSSLKDLQITLPAGFVKAFGYHGSARHVAVGWIPLLEELRWSDDGHAHFGIASAWQELRSDPVADLALLPFDYANETWRVRPWLLIDRYTGGVSFGSPADIWAVLEQQCFPQASLASLDGCRRLGTRPDHVAHDAQRQRQPVGEQPVGEGGQHGVARADTGQREQAG